MKCIILYSEFIHYVDTLQRGNMRFSALSGLTYLPLIITFEIPFWIKDTAVHVERATFKHFGCIYVNENLLYTCRFLGCCADMWTFIIVASS